MDSNRSLCEGLVGGWILVASALGVFLAGVAAGCSLESGLEGSECSSDGEISEDGTRRCENGYWVEIDGGTVGDADVGVDSGSPDGVEGDGGPDIGPDANCDDPTSWYRDEDGDGFGTSDQSQTACEPPQGYVDNDEDCDDADAAVRPDVSEICNGTDDDCDGDVDEGCGCTYDPGETDNIDTDMSHNSGVCVAQEIDANDACEKPGEFEPRADAESGCNGLDNDCDGATDEGCGCTYDPGEAENVDTDGSHDTGPCTGQMRGSSGVCTQPNVFEMRTGTESRCSGVDNDCDGVVDEGCACVYDPNDSRKIDSDNSNDDGVCTNQTIETNGDCADPSGFESPTDMEANCNRVDNDCDGAVDEGCACTYDPDDSDNADSDGDNREGVCLNQSRDANGRCGEPSKYDDTDDESSVSLCKGRDNDCDGATDEGCTCTYDPTRTDNVDMDGSHGSGLCTGQTRDSTGSCQKPGDFEPQMPGETLCDDEDNDCDGDTDENITNVCYTGKTGTAGAGICQKGTETCNNGSFGSCQGDTVQSSDPATAEINCSNSKDDDCDGSSDSNDCFFRNTVSGNPRALVADIAVDSSNGDVYYVGTDGDIWNGSTTESFVVKIDSSGMRQWKETLNSQDIAARGIALDTSNSRVYVAGGAENAVAGESISGDSDGFIAKYDLSGNRQNVVTVGSSSRDEFDDIAFDPDDTAVAVGGYTGGDYSGSNSGSLDAVVAEYDPSLNKRWVAQFGRSSTDVVETLDVDASNGDVYAGGDTRGTIASSGTHQGSGDIYVARFDSAGSRQWIDQRGSSDDDDVQGVSVEDGTAAYVVGNTDGDLETLTNAGDDDAFLSKWSQSGNLDWIESVGTGGHDDFSSSRYDSDSQTVVVAGSTEGTPDSTGNAGSYDALVASYTTGGTQNWVETRGEGDYDAAYGIGSSTSSSALYVGGTWGLDASTGSSDGFISRIQ